METYKNFLDRINSFEKCKPDFGNSYFAVSPSVAQKVDNNNRFKNFYGDTVVFDLSKTIKSVISTYIDFLYNTAPQCFSERLESNSLHITLHDLSNSSELQVVSEELFYNELKIIKLQNKIKQLANEKIRLRNKTLFNMANISLVLGFYPVDEYNYCKLKEIYSLIDDVKRLNYSLTPHVTLAYYNINGFDLSSAKILASAVEKLNNEVDLEINVGNLYYQKFISMNNYISIINLTE